MADIRLFQRQFISSLKHARDTCFPLCVRRFFLFRLLQSWLFQGCAGAHWTELLFRVSLEIMVAAGLVCMLCIWTHCAIVWAVLGAHTLTWMFNGHVWALKIRENTRLVRNTPERIKGYIAGLDQRLKRAESITACVLSGSLSRGQFHSYSDLDVWFTRKRGFLNSLRAYVFGVRERSIAFLRKIPIELYFYDPDDYRGKELDESLLLLKDAEGRWSKVEPRSEVFTPEQLSQMTFFRRSR